MNAVLEDLLVTTVRIDPISTIKITIPTILLNAYRSLSKHLNVPLNRLIGTSLLIGDDNLSKLDGYLSETPKYFEELSKYCPEIAHEVFNILNGFSSESFSPYPNTRVWVNSYIDLPSAIPKSFSASLLAAKSLSTSPTAHKLSLDTIGTEVYEKYSSVLSMELHSTANWITAINNLI